ncbi:MAG: hypothetical protein GY804_03055 [Alphaproteobacteria bacterium]|nr:hypothetical protein [Alphaproteobacteria bacterium]
MTMTDIETEIKIEQAEKNIQKVEKAFNETLLDESNINRFFAGSESILILKKDDNTLVAAQIEDDKGNLSYGTFNNDGKTVSMCVCQSTDDKNKKEIVSANTKLDEAFKLIKDHTELAVNALEVPCKCTEVEQFQKKALTLKTEFLASKIKSR